MNNPTFEKVRVTLPRALVDSARAHAGTPGFSAYVAERRRLAEHLADLDDFLSSHAAEHGPVPESLTEGVHQAWPDPHRAANAGKPKPRRHSSSTAKA